MKPETCGCREYRASAEPGICECHHDRRPYHKRGVGPCWYPVKMAAK
jgi:hypothetical protein